MSNVLAILIMSSGFSAAVETSDGFVERSFPNTDEGVRQFIAYSEPLIAKAGKPVKICTVTLTEDPGDVMAWLLGTDKKPALLSRHVYREYVTKSGESPSSGTTAARACLSAFPFIRKLG